jgi:hypothetical protein
MPYGSFSYQLASDVVRDGMSLELLDSNGQVVAEVFRSDAQHSVQLSTFQVGLEESVIRELATAAVERLGPFEDGTRLEAAMHYDALVEQAGGRSNNWPERTREG